MPVPNLPQARPTLTIQGAVPAPGTVRTSRPVRPADDGSAGSPRERIDHALLVRFHRRGDAFARDEVVERCLPLVRSLARRYGNRGQEMEDLVQAGTIGLVKAVDRFDVDSGRRFISYAVPNILGEIRRHFRDHTWALHVPRSLQELDARVKIVRAAEVARTGSEPSDGDVAEILEVPLGDVLEARRAGLSYRAASLDAPLCEARTMAETTGACDPGYDQVDAAATVEDAMLGLSDRQRQVLALRFEDDLLQREIAEVIGVSQMQVSRIIHEAVEKMGDRVGVPAAPAVAG